MTSKTTILGGVDFDDDHISIAAPTTGDAAILMKEFGIDPAGPLVPRWTALAQALAKKYHPDYKNNRPGPITHRTTAYYAMLLGTVVDLMERRNFKDGKAALHWAYDNCPATLVGPDRVAKIPSKVSLYKDYKQARRLKKDDIIW